MRSRIFITGLISCLVIQSSFAAEGLQSAETKNVISDYAKTKYPLVFVHGMFGFNRLGSAEFGLDYWYQVLPDLAKNGATAYATQVSPLSRLKYVANNCYNKSKKSWQSLAKTRSI